VTSLRFKELWILSKVEKAATRLSLAPGLNILVGENDVGKSTLVKSLYHCLGADTPQLSNTHWKKARPIYCVLIEIGSEQFYVVRDERYFGVFDINRQLISRHTGAVGPSGIATFINAKLGFDIELERHADATLGPAGPAFYFLPFYIDQDEGWLNSWSSFNGLRQFSNYRKLMIEYHLAVRSQDYYDAKKLDMELRRRLAELEKDRTALQSARASVEKRKQKVQVDLDPAAFRNELEALVDQYNDVHQNQQATLAKLKDVRGQRNLVDGELGILRNAIVELEADYSYTESSATPEVVGCPTCGTEFANSFVERFGILDDIDRCASLVDQWLKRRSSLSVDLQAVEREYRLGSQGLSDLEITLRKTKENITLSELIASEGMKEMISSLNEDIRSFLARESDLNSDLRIVAERMKLDPTWKRKIVDWYKTRMTEYLDALNVQVLTENDYSSLEKQIKNNALGSDLPRALLAQCFAFLSAMSNFSDFVVCPMIIDSPFQQEQDLENRLAIMEFISTRGLRNQQMVLATISVAEFVETEAVQSANVKRFDHKLGLLDRDLYSDVLAHVGPMHRQVLAA
jgi:predicted  nucleic acid-binding Zn-ribbon protein